MKLREIFFEKKGKPSLKRISGSIMLFNGLLGKNILAIYAMGEEIKQYAEIDETFSYILGGGVVLLFGSIIDKFVKK